MPRRTENSGNSEANKKQRLEELTSKGVIYSGLKNKEKTLKKDLTKINGEIKVFAKNNSDLFTPNGNHKEVSVPIGDGVNELFVQLQKAQSVRAVDNVIALVKDKLGDKKASEFLVTQEVLPESSLESMYNQGLITKEELLDWTVTKETERLIVKVQKVD